MSKDFFHKPLPKWTKVSAPLVVLLAIYLLFFNQLLTGEQIWFAEDVMLFWAPFKFHLASHLKHGAIPLWNPYVGGGFPQLAESQTGVFNPLNALFLVLPFPLAFNYYVIVYFFLGGLFTYLFLRSLHIQPVPSLTGSIVFSLGAFFVCHANHFNVLSAAAFLPLCFFLIERWRHSRHLSLLLGLSLVIAIQILSGHLQIVFYSIVASTCYFLYRSFFTEQERPYRWFTPLVLWLMVLGLSVGLASIQLIPTFELTQFTQRASPRAGLASSWSFPPWHFLTYVFPNLFGFSRASYLPTKFWYRVFYHYRINYWEVACYVGILPLLLTASSFFGSLRRPANFFRLMLLASFVLMLGRFTPVSSLIGAIPLIKSFRVPARFIFLATFSFAVLSAMCIDALAGENRRFSIERVILTSFGVCVFLAGALSIFLVQGGRIGQGLLSFLVDIFNRVYPYWAPEPITVAPLPKGFSIFFAKHLSWVLYLSNPSVYIPIIFLTLSMLLLILAKLVKIKPNILQFLFLLLVVIDLSFFGYSYNVPTQTKKALSEPQIFQLLKKDKDDYRILVTKNLNKLSSNSNVLWGVRSLRIYSPLKLNRVREYTGAMFTDIQKDKTELMSYANTKYLIIQGRYLGRYLEESYVYDKIRVYKNNKVLPRAFMASKIKTASTPDEVLAALREKGSETYLLGIVENSEQLSPAVINSKAKGSVKFTSDEAGKATFRVEASGDALLVYNESYYPGWKAYIDGAPSPIYRTNYLFQGVVVPRGNHTVEFRFESTSFRMGMLISGVSFIALLTLFFLTNRGRWKHGPIERGWHADKDR